MSLTSPLLDNEKSKDLENDSNESEDENVPSDEDAQGEGNTERNISDIEVAKAYAMVNNLIILYLSIILKLNLNSFYLLFDLM